MATFVFANNVSTTLASPITTSGQTSIVLSSAANLPTISGSQQFALTLNDAATRAVIEVVYVTSRVGATLTVVRGQEGTTATTWLAGDYAYGSATAGVLATFASLAGSATQPFSASQITLGTTVLTGTTIGGSTWFPYTITKFTSSGTFTTPSDGTTSTVYRYRMVGAGGGGGGTAGTWAAAGGGGSGAYAEGYFSGVAGSTGITITVGTGGTAGANTGGTGGTGVSTVIGSPISVTCNGGSGGLGSTATAANANAGGTGGTSSGGSPTLTVTGGTGFAGVAVASTNIQSGTGASSLFGNGGVNDVLIAGGGAPGNAPNTPSYGAGASGAAGISSIGGVGGGGLVIIERMTP